MMYSVFQNLQQSVAQLTEELKKEKAEHQLTKNSLQKSETRLRILTNQASLIIWEVDSKGIFTFVKGEKTIKSTIKSEDLIGQSIFELHKDHQEVLDKTHLALAGNEVKWFERGEYIEYETRVIPQISESGEITGLIGVNINVNASKNTQVEDPKSQLRLKEKVEEKTSALRESNEQLIEEIVKHKQAREELLYRLNFEELITTLSTHFINLAPDEIDRGIQVALEWIGSFSGVDRSYIFLLDETGSYINNDYEWCASGIKPQIEQRKQIPITALEEWNEQIKNLETIYIPSTTKLPKEKWISKIFLRLQCIKSLVVVPIVYRGIFIGFLGFDSVKEEKNWSEDIIDLLRIMGEMFINALERKRVETALAESEKKYRHLVETSQDLIWSLDTLGRFTFVNQAAKRIYGYDTTEIIGRSITNFIYQEEVEKSTAASTTNITQIPIFTQDSCSSCQWETIHKRQDGIPVYLNFNAIALRDKFGNFEGAIGTATDITERKKSEEALQRAKDQLQAVLDAVPWFVSWINSELIYIGVNRQLAANFNLPPEKFIGQEVGFLGSSWGFVDFISDFFPSSAQQISREVEITVNGSVKNYLVVVQKYAQGKALVSVGIDITARKQAEAMKSKLIASLQESEKKFRSLYEATSDAVILLDKNGIIDCNLATLKMFGLNNKEEFYNHNLADFYPESQQNGKKSSQLIKRYMIQAIVKGNSCFEWINQRVDKSEFPTEVLLTAMKTSEYPQKKSSKKSTKNIVFQAVIRDITERKHHEEQIKESLAEKEVLLKEIHHRVKNNLQVISSLLRLQSRYIEDERILEMLKESQNRVRSMALVHEHLYQSKDLSKVNFTEYISSLAAHLFQAYAVKARGVKLNINVIPVCLNIDTVVPCGLIINELVSNSLKYAFPEEFRGEIFIEFDYDDRDQNQFILKVADNGISFAQDLDYKKSGSLGLRLVCSLVRQLKGKIELINEVGTVFKITFSSWNASKL
ncbi:MAG: PAS domain S-box protein [Okeania sp. SIO2C9]|uniref:PAS domain S-box protein n=1 Tax=Okeania sp. SIO2C9 TaxID=2607791 RepID=UPI0013C0694E|nr:PAS domain S-box protein [Okeania sp. SIO2C9]NEQ76994.1 PAS domain S-box protein [Okeania sp. SIO2C9]